MKTTLITIGLFIAAGVAAAQAIASLEGSYILPVDDRAIRYSHNGTRNAVAVLERRIARKFAGITLEERTTLLAILGDTLPDLPR